MVDGVLQFTGAQYSFSATVHSLYSRFRRRTKASWCGLVGMGEPSWPRPRGTHDTPGLSPDGPRVAVGTDGQVWLYDFSRETLTRFTFEGSENQDPVWTPDGKRIAFESNKEGPSNVFWQLADGSGGLERLTTSEYNDNPSSGPRMDNPWPSVNTLLLRDLTWGSCGWRTAKRSLCFEHLLTKVRHGFPTTGGGWPNASDESGRNEIYVQPYPGFAGKWQISTEGGREPVWNPNGRELFYRSGDKMMAVEITTQPGFAAGKPRVLFEGNICRPCSQSPSTMSHPTASVS